MKSSLLAVGAALASAASVLAQSEPAATPGAEAAPRPEKLARRGGERAAGPRPAPVADPRPVAGGGARPQGVRPVLHLLPRRGGRRSRPLGGLARSPPPEPHQRRLQVPLDAERRAADRRGPPPHRHQRAAHDLHAALGAHRRDGARGRDPVREDALPRFASEPQGKPIAIPAAPAFTQEMVQKGKAVWDKVQCAACHGDTGKGDGASARTLRDDWGFPIVPHDFTQGPLKVGDAPEDLYRAFMTGLNGSPMPSFAETLSPDDAWALVAYVRTLRRE